MCESSIRNQSRFDNAKTLVVTGERAEESSARAKYKEFEPDRADGRKGRKQRHVDRWRPIHQWKEQRVWDAMADLNIIAHPAYRLGWGRLSCMSCIFGNKDQWASVREVSGKFFDAIEQAEALTGKTIHRTKSVVELADAGNPYPGTLAGTLCCAAMTRTYYDDVLVPLGGKWVLPAGAFGDSTGPT